MMMKIVIYDDNVDDNINEDVEGDAKMMIAMIEIAPFMRNKI